MDKSNIKPETITKPIQLLAVWLLGLLLLVSGLLTAAATLKSPSWLPSFFSISAVAIIPLFLILIFLLQTRFRPEMQEDIYYSKYLNRDTNKFEIIQKNKEKTIVMEEMVEISDKTRQQLEEMGKMLLKMENQNENQKKLEPLIINSEEQIKILEKRIKLNNIDLNINKTHSCYNEILEVVKNVGFTKFNEFGTSKTPTDFVISFGENISADIIRDLITQISQFTDGYIKPSTTANNAIVIGSYRTSDKKIKINTQLLNRLNKIKESNTIIDIIN